MSLSFDARTALIPIDVQRGFDLSPGRVNNPAMEANGLRLLAAWRAAGLPLAAIDVTVANASRRSRPVPCAFPNNASTFSAPRNATNANTAIAAASNAGEDVKITVVRPRSACAIR